VFSIREQANSKQQTTAKFRFNWTKGYTRRGCCEAATGPNDVVAEKIMHQKTQKLADKWG